MFRLRFGSWELKYILNMMAFIFTHVCVTLQSECTLYILHHLGLSHSVLTIMGPELGFLKPNLSRVGKLHDLKGNKLYSSYSFPAVSCVHQCGDFV